MLRSNAGSGGWIPEHGPSGLYKTTHGTVKKIVHQARFMTMQNQTTIPMDDVVRIEMEVSGT